MQHRGGLTPPPAGRRRRATKPSSTTQHCLKKVYLHPTPLRRSWHTHINRLGERSRRLRAKMQKVPWRMNTQGTFHRTQYLDWSLSWPTASLYTRLIQRAQISVTPTRKTAVKVQSAQVTDAVADACSPSSQRAKPLRAALRSSHTLDLNRSQQLILARSSVEQYRRGAR